MNNHSFPESYFSSALSASKSPLPTSEELDEGLSPFRRHLAKFIKELPQNAVVLDAGCGNGKAVRMIKVYRPDIIIHAVDITEVSHYLPTGTIFTKITVEDLETRYEPNTFDAIICLHVIEHLLYPLKMMQSFNYVLKTEGRIFLETPNWARLYIPFSTMFFWNDYTHVRPLSSYGVKRLFNAYGFNNIITRTVSSHVWSAKVTGGKARETAISSDAKSLKPSLWYRLANRILNPLIKDTLIVEAKKNISYDTP